MKKLLCVVSVLMMSLVVVGCGNSPDGDARSSKRRLLLLCKAATPI